MTRITYIFSLAFYLNKEKDESVRSTAGTPMTKSEKNQYGSEGRLWFLIIAAKQEWKYAAAEATPGVQCSNMASDPSSLYRRSERTVNAEINVNDIRNLHYYIFMEVGFDKSAYSNILFCKIEDVI